MGVSLYTETQRQARDKERKKGVKSGSRPACPNRVWCVCQSSVCAFLDGDVYFRKLHSLADVFFDQDGDGLSVLTPAVNNTALAESDQTAINVAAGPSAKNWQRSGCVDAWSADNATSAEGSVRGRCVVPPAYNFLATSRAPIVQIGYFGFSPEDGYLTGSVIGGKFVSRSSFLGEWSKARATISSPFVAVAALNENWGFVCTTFPNLTTNIMRWQVGLLSNCRAQQELTVPRQAAVSARLAL